ncbi:MAG: DUF134 domain-containing protein [Candidatus Eisenbacteria bacterium]|uniref:UPF0251 protein KJ970_11650 n=1 Tax=Eiseniibacteriota bacterium TaxID=2212470 RepID=A0A948RYQ2_UNCEI|nr:DUF134 domain-containing protein [Candidatus Eisenbacteria bacterium]MBU1949743.1 DUF134 domain-containing protein [Candidatus Eisenbacteria bacterium]MBU2691572.1 DUF134 domain-containing protein [Candidatus Eisenbacteria bacterium]
MPRPRKKRSVYCPPFFSDFKPAGIRGSKLESLWLALDEFEAIRLADFLGMDHAEAADQMDISRSTFSRLAERARYKMAQFLIEGRHLRIDGGDVHFRGNLIRCQSCQHMFNSAFDLALEKCPSCGSSNLMDMANAYGHGDCCLNYHHRK